MITALRNLPAPAKLNLFLHVTGRRADGYHLLETVFDLIDLADTVHLTLREDGQVLRETRLRGVGDPEQDLTVRAARLLARHTGCRLGVSIGLDKRIPMGAGLGGGSSDAATVLLGLNRLWHLQLDRPTLQALALQLGADVPFFVYGATAYASGVGEQLRACPQPERHFVLIAPGVHVPTASVFTAPELTRDTKPLKIFGLSRSEAVFRGKNDLQAVVQLRHAKVAQALALLRQTAETFGVDPGFARMTGSGSCVFLSVPTDRLAAVVSHLRERCSAHPAFQIRAVRSLSAHPLREWAFA